MVLYLPALSPPSQSSPAFLKHPQQRLLLPLIKLAFQSVKQFCLVDQKFRESKRALLCFNRYPGEPRKPVRDFILSVGCLQRVVVTCPPDKDGGSQHDERRLTETLSQGLFSNRPSDAAVAILKKDGSIENTNVRCPALVGAGRIPVPPAAVRWNQSMNWPYRGELVPGQGFESGSSARLFRRRRCMGSTPVR